MKIFLKAKQKWICKKQTEAPYTHEESNFDICFSVLAVVPPEAGRLLGRGGVATSGGPARSQPKRGNRWILTRADGSGDFNCFT